MNKQITDLKIGLLGGGQLLVAATLMLFFSSCEGFKALSVYNKTGSEITIETRPELPQFKHTTFPPQSRILSDAKVYEIKSDSVLTLHSTFGPMFIGSKLRAKDLSINYLKIITQSDTIIANSKEEIIKLTKNINTKYKKNTDKNTPILGGTSNFKAIVIRK